MLDVESGHNRVPDPPAIITVIINLVYNEVMEMNFCRRCGSDLANDGGGVFTCKNNHTLFLNAVPTTNVFFINNNNEVLLSVRGIDPYKGKLDAFGGFLEENESAEEGLAREITEELQLTPDQYSRPEFLCSSTSPYPFGGETRTVFAVLFWSQLSPDANPIPSDDVAATKLLPLDQINLADVAADDIRKGIEKLRELFLPVTRGVDS